MPSVRELRGMFERPTEDNTPAPGFNKGNTPTQGFNKGNTPVQGFNTGNTPARGSTRTTPPPRGSTRAPPPPRFYQGTAPPTRGDSKGNPPTPGDERKDQVPSSEPSKEDPWVHTTSEKLRAAWDEHCGKNNHNTPARRDKGEDGTRKNLRVHWEDETKRRAPAQEPSNDHAVAIDLDRKLNGSEYDRLNLVLQVTGDEAMAHALNRELNESARSSARAQALEGRPPARGDKGKPPARGNRARGNHGGNHGDYHAPYVPLMTEDGHLVNRKTVTLVSCLADNGGKTSHLARGLGLNKPGNACLMNSMVHCFLPSLSIADRKVFLERIRAACAKNPNEMMRIDEAMEWLEGIPFEFNLLFGRRYPGDGFDHFYSLRMFDARRATVAIVHHNNHFQPWFCNVTSR